MPKILAEANHLTTHSYLKISPSLFYSLGEFSNFATSLVVWELVTTKTISIGLSAAGIAQQTGFHSQQICCPNRYPALETI